MVKTQPQPTDNSAFSGEQVLAPGTRVRLTGSPIAVTLRSDRGVVVRPDRWEGFVIVRLDTPAIYRHVDGHDEELPEIREGIDNLEVLTA